MSGLLISNCPNPCGCGPVATCRPISSSPTGSFTSGISYGDTWNLNGVPNCRLVGANTCTPTLSLFTGLQQSQTTVYTQPGVLITNSFIGHNFSAFNWTYTVVYDGITILTESGSFPGGSSDIGQGNAFLQFTNPGWHSVGTAQNPDWQLDYTGPASSNPLPQVNTTLSIAGSDTFTQPGTPTWQYRSIGGTIISASFSGGDDSPATAGVFNVTGTPSQPICPPNNQPITLYFFDGNTVPSQSSGPGIILGGPYFVNGLYGWTFKFYYDSQQGGLNVLVYSASGTLDISGGSSQAPFLLSLGSVGWIWTGSQWEFNYTAPSGSVSTNNAPRCTFQLIIGDPTQGYDHMNIGCNGWTYYSD